MKIQYKEKFLRGLTRKDYVHFIGLYQFKVNQFFHTKKNYFYLLIDLPVPMKYSIAVLQQYSAVWRVVAAHFWWYTPKQSSKTMRNNGSVHQQKAATHLAALKCDSAYGFIWR